MRHGVEQACVFHRTDHALAEVPYDLTAWRWSSVFSMFTNALSLCGVIGCRAFSRAPADEPRRIDEYLGDLPELALVTKVLADTSLHESLGDRTMERIHGFS